MRTGIYASIAIGGVLVACVVAAATAIQEPVSRTEIVLSNEWLDVAFVPARANAGILASCFAFHNTIIVPVPIGPEGRELGDAIERMKDDWVWFVRKGLAYGCSNNPSRSHYEIYWKARVPKARFHDDAVKLDPTHNTVLAENEGVRVVRIHFGPGESGPMVDKRARVIIMLTDSHATVTLPDGHSEVRDGKAGTVAFSKGGRQATNNVGTTELENIVVELKGK